MKTLLLLSFHLILCSCIFGKQPKSSALPNLIEEKNDAKPNELKPESNNPISMEIDTDGDGMTDAIESKKGTDPLIANIPEIKTLRISQIETSVEFYSPSQKKYQTLRLNEQESKFQIEGVKNQFETAPASPYLETLMLMKVFSHQHQQSSLKIPSWDSRIHSYSSPGISEKGITALSDRVLNFQRMGFQLQSASALIQTRFTINSEFFSSYRKPIFDIYYQSNESDQLVFLESKQIEGNFKMNTENQVSFDLQLRDEKVIQNAFLNGGSRLYISLKDFIIDEKDLHYTNILEAVELKSIPVLTSIIKNKDKIHSELKTLYVGSNGEPISLNEVLKRGFKEGHTINQQNIEQIDGVFNLDLPLNDKGEKETFRWFIGTDSQIKNPFTHKFQPRQNIALSFLSIRKTVKSPQYATRSILTNGQAASSGKLPLGTSTVKITIIPQEVAVPSANQRPISLPHCGQGSWDANTVNYNQTYVHWTKKTNSFTEHFIKDAFIKISSPKRVLIEGNVLSLMNEGKLKITPTEGGSFELVFTGQIQKVPTDYESPLSAQLQLSPRPVLVQDGAMVETSRNCQRTRHEPPRGADSGRGGGGRMKSMEMINHGVGFAETAVYPKYDLNVHFVAY